MQTFLPYDSIIESAKALDYKRLGKQRVEAKQILNALQGKSKGWTTHPATLMWRGYEQALMWYHDTMILEWVKRGYNNTMPLLADNLDYMDIEWPAWLGDKSFHDSHKSKLLQKDPVYYGKFGWDVPVLDYVWPKPKY